MFKWLPGRQADVVYHKWCFLRVKLGPYGVDAYVLRYPAHTLLPPHTDPLQGKHWRCNISLWGTSYFQCSPGGFHLGELVHCFRPDVQQHELHAVTKTYKLSFGLAHFRSS